MRTLKTSLLVLLTPLVAIGASRDRTLEPGTSSQTAPAAAAQAPAPSASSAAPAATKAAPAASPAPTATTTAAVPGAPAATDGFALTVELDHSLGANTFVDRLNPTFGGTLALTPTYAFQVRGTKLVARGTWALAYEYTAPDGSVNGRRVAPTNVGLGLSAPGLIKHDRTGIAIAPGIGATLPTTLEAWNATLITTLSASLKATVTLWKFDLSVGGGGSRGFHQSTVNAGRVGRDQLDAQGNRIALFRPNEVVTDFGGMNTAWGANVNAGVTFHATEALGFSVTYRYAHSWKYPAQACTLNCSTPSKLDSIGNSVGRDGFGHSDLTTAGVGVDYQLNDHWSVSLSAATEQAPLSPTRSVRFPFFSLNTSDAPNYMAGGSTSVGITLAASY